MGNFSISGGEIIATILASGLTSLGIKLVYDFVKVTKSRNDAARHLAMRLAVLFEGHAIDCAKKVITHDAYIEHDESGTVIQGEEISEVPAVPPLPEQGNYEVLDRDSLEDILIAPQAHDSALKSLKDLLNMGEIDAYLTGRRNTVVRIGATSLGISERLRKAHKLSARNFVHYEWDSKKFLEEENSRLENARNR